MDSPKIPVSDPSILLLNEIEILLAQSRLLELYLKQSQATAAYETARVHDQYQQELAELRTLLAEQERIVAAKETAVGARERDRQQRVQSLQAELSESQRRLQQHDAEYRRVESEAADLRERAHQLELAKAQAQTWAGESAKASQGLTAELAGLRAQLEENQLNFQKHQVTSRALQDELQAQIAQLHDQLSEKTIWSQSADTELQQAKGELVALHEQIAALQASREQARQAAAQELAESRARFELQLNRLQTVLAERERALEENQNETSELERELRTEILTLRSQLEQKRELIEFRDEELRVDQSQIAGLHQRIAELEAAEEAARINADQADNARRSYESQIAGLQHEVTVRERALTEHQAALSASELALHGKIQSLQQELFHRHSDIEQREHALQIARAEAEALRTQIGQQESAVAADLAARQRAEETCRELEAEVSKLLATLAEKEHALNERDKVLDLLQQQSRSEIDQLHRQVDQQRALLDTSDAELGHLRSVMGAVEEQKSRLAAAHDELDRRRQQEEAARVDLEARLLAKDDELQAVRAKVQELAQAALREQENQFKSLAEQNSSEIVGLRSRLQEQELAAQQSHVELAQLRAESTGLREQIARTEQSRDELERELQLIAAQRDELVVRGQTHDDEFKSAQERASEHLAALEEQKTRFHLLEEERRNEIADLQSQLERQRIHAESLHEDLTRLRAESAEFQEQNAQVEHYRRELEQNRQETSARRAELERRVLAKDAELEAAQSGVSAMQSQFDARINELHLQLTQKQLLVESRAAEIENLKGHVDRLSEQLARRDSEGGDLQAHFQEELESVRAEHQAALDALRDEYQIKQNKLDDELAREKQRAGTLLHQTAQLEQQKSTIEARVKERELKHEALNAEAAALRSRLDDLEMRRQTELAAAERGQNQERSDLEAELAAARSELRQQAWVSAQHQATIAALHRDYEVKQHQHDDQLAQERQRVAELTLHIREFEQQKTVIQTRFEERQREQEALTVEAAGLRSRLDELEIRRQTELAAAERAQNQVRSDLEAELTGVRSELQQKAWASAQHQATLENLALAHKDQIQKLEGKIAEQQNSIDDRHLQLERSHAQARLLEQRIEELNTESREAELTAVNRAVHIKEEYGIRIAELERQLAQKTVELQEHGASTSDAEQTLRREIDRLVREAQEKNQILQDRNDELVRVKAEMDALGEQFRNVESTASQAETSFSAEAEKMRTEFQAQLALLQAELSQKEWALEEQRAATGTIEAQLRQNLERLNHQLVETEARAKENQDNFVMGENRRTSEQQERYRKFHDTVDAVVVGNAETFPASESRRRWRDGFGWKRRWKS